MKRTTHYTVTYRDAGATATSTYRFDVDASRDVATANQHAWAFMRAITAAGGSAGYPQWHYATEASNV